MSIDILLPTYNGSKYIRVLLDSLFDQTYTDWHLYVRDDGSKDNTPEILHEYADSHPGKITIVDVGGKNIGINEGFSTLLKSSKAEYACFCDQDDKWMEDKLEVSLKTMQKLESELPDKPCLTYSNLCMVDEKLNIVDESRWRHDKIKPHYLSLPKMLMQNPVNGCVMIMNKRLVELIQPIPEDVVWFDHWVALVAAAAGKVDFINRTTIWYRLHEHNSSRGLNAEDHMHYYFEEALLNKNFREYFNKLELQAVATKKRLDEHGYHDDRAFHVIDDFLSITKSGPVKRRWTMLKHGMVKHTWKGTIKWFLRI